MAVETERRSSGVWTVLYEPSVPPKTIERYQEMFQYLGDVILTSIRFKAMNLRGMACFQAVEAFAKPTNQLLSKNLGFVVDGQPWLGFSEKINSLGSSQSGQNALRIQELNPLKPIFSVIDPACYLYDIPYDQMPIAVGSHHFIERAMTELYSSATQRNIEITLSFR